MMKKYSTGGNNPKKKKPNLKKTDTFADYKTAASQFSDYNPESDTVFVGMSLDPGAAERQTQRSANISSAKGASDSNYNAIPKMYKTKNEEGKTVYVSLSKHSKYSQGGIMQSKKYRAGGQNPPQKKPTYGPPKPPGYKEPSKEEMKERKDEASYNKMRKELDRELASMKKRGATEDQINKYADKMISAWARNR